jgi:diadenylate cyclase
MNAITMNLLPFDWLVFGKFIVQSFIIVYAVLWVWRRILGTQAERLIYGVLVLAAVYLVFDLLGFSMITSILRHLVPVAIIAAVIIFQPEIRKGLGYLGRMKSFQLDFSLVDNEAKDLRRDINQIIVAVRECSRNKYGALIVVEPPEAERYYVSPGTEINAEISSSLLLSIFFPKSPLHDGAVVIRHGKVVSAGVILPMTDNPKLSYQYGTRHRAAIGLSEMYDSLCIVVSEETGAISAASQGTLVTYSKAEELSEPISSVYERTGSSKTSHLVAALSNLVPFGRKVVPSSALKKKLAKGHGAASAPGRDQGTSSI